MKHESSPVPTLVYSQATCFLVCPVHYDYCPLGVLRESSHLGTASSSPMTRLLTVHADQTLVEPYIGLRTINVDVCIGSLQ